MKRSKAKPGPDDPDVLFAKRVAALKLSPHVQNCLRAAGIKTIGDLVAKNEAELNRTKVLGRYAIKKIKTALKKLGLHLSRW